VRPLADAEERRLIADALDRNLVVEAAAGTGKTTELTNRIVAVLESGAATIDGLVAVTFTEKAAGELKLRLRSALEEARRRAAAGSLASSRLTAALARLEEARVSTIHGFCSDLLRERPVEARVDPRFVTLTDADAERLFRQVFRGFLEKRLEDPPEGVRRALRRRSRDADPVDRLRRAAWQLVEWRDFPAPWRRDPFEREGEIDALVAELARLAERSAACEKTANDNLYRDSARLRDLDAAIRSAERSRPRDHDGLEASLVELPGSWRPAKGRGAYAEGIARDDLYREVLDFKAALLDFARRADADLAALLKAELGAVLERYEEAKAKSGRLDFLDLLVRSRDLLRGDASVRADFQRRFTRIFVDEFQDTDPLQAEILLLLASSDPSVDDWRQTTPEPGKLFIVGDPKQSIYRFRRADVGTYRQVKEILLSRGALSAPLSTSFRATPALQRAVNRAFKPLMSGGADELQADYVPLSPHRADHAGERPSVIALPLGVPPDARAKEIADAIPETTAAFVDWLVNESGWTVTERERPGEQLPIAPRHVCLLFRRFATWGEDVTRPYVEALEARGIPHLLVGGKSYHLREEVETMRTALTALEWPDDELSVFATLHGPLFAVGDEELLLWRHTFKRLHPFRIPKEVPADLAPVSGALSILASLSAGRNRRPVAETIDRLLALTRAASGFVLRLSGEQALANVRHLTELARAYEAGGGLSFRGFVERIRDEADAGEAPEAPVLEEGSEGVRMMTVHKAKGLEFPVVVLCDLTCKLARDASRTVDAQRGLAALSLAGWVPAEVLDEQARETARDQAEGVRLAYVAATRARDILAVPLPREAPFDKGWLSPLNPSLYMRGTDSADVHWFDTELLRFGAPNRAGLRWEDVLGSSDDEADEAIAAGDLAAHEAWSQARAGAIERGSRPSLVVRPATEVALQPFPEGPPRQASLFEEPPASPESSVPFVELSREARRPAGPRFGTLVHAVLATVPLDSGEEAIADAARLQGRLLGATEEEVAAAGTVARTALAHELLRRAAEAARRGACRRETPLTLRLPDGTLVEGIVDLAFQEGDAWTVVDFKTDRELVKGLDVYRRQVELYARAIAAATGQKASGVLLAV